MADEPAIISNYPRKAEGQLTLSGETLEELRKAVVESRNLTIAFFAATIIGLILKIGFHISGIGVVTGVLVGHGYRTCRSFENLTNKIMGWDKRAQKDFRLGVSLFSMPLTGSIVWFLVMRKLQKHLEVYEMDAVLGLPEKNLGDATFEPPS